MEASDRLTSASGTMWAYMGDLRALRGGGSYRRVYDLCTTVYCITGYVLQSMHYGLCITGYALRSMHFRLCITRYALWAMHYGLCIMVYVLRSMHYRLCITRYALWAMHYGLCTMHHGICASFVYYALLCIYII